MICKIKQTPQIEHQILENHEKKKLKMVTEVEKLKASIMVIGALAAAMVAQIDGEVSNAQICGCD
jgi:hypothetical protein